MIQVYTLWENSAFQGFVLKYYFREEDRWEGRREAPGEFVGAKAFENTSSQS